MDGAVFELGTDGPTCILVGIDGTDTSLRAGAYAAGMARRQGAALVAVYVVPTAAVSTQLAATTGAMIQVHEEIIEQIRGYIVSGTQQTGITAQFIVRTGNPYKELIAVADEMRVDAVVVGASTQSGRRFVGSLAGRLVRDATWPITVVP